MKNMVFWTTWNSVLVRGIGIAVLALLFLVIHGVIPSTLCICMAQVESKVEVFPIVSKEVENKSSAEFKNKTTIEGLKMGGPRPGIKCPWFKEPFQITKPYKGKVTLDEEDEAYLVGPKVIDPRTSKEVIDPKTRKVRRKGWGIDNFLYFVIKKKGKKTDRFFCGHNFNCKVMYEGKELKNISKKAKFHFRPGEINLTEKLYNYGKETEIEVYPMDFGGALWVTEIYLIIE